MMKITLKENEPCQLDFQNPENTTCILPSNSENDDLNEPSALNSYYYAQSRQTDEEFRSAAPPDCRITSQLCSDGLDDTDEDYDDEIKKI